MYELSCTVWTACASSRSWRLSRESPFGMQHQCFKHGQGDKFVSVKTCRKSVNGERNVRRSSQELSRRCIEQLIQSEACGSSWCERGPAEWRRAQTEADSIAMHFLDKITGTACEEWRSAGWLIRIDVASAENCLRSSCRFSHSHITEWLFYARRTHLVTIG